MRSSLGAGTVRAIPGAFGSVGAMPPDVSVIVLRYNGGVERLRACVGSVVTEAQRLAGSDVRVEVLVVDNASVEDPQAADRVAAEHAPLVRSVRMDRNHGFAGGVNRGVALTAGSMVLLLNDDAVLMPGALGEAVRVLRAAPDDVVAVALKMLLASDPFVLDGVGIAVNERGEAFNRGLGQPDVGQYDASEDCLGPCFGAALIRRSAFGPDVVGPLNESFFLYYEDVEWSWRASLAGWRTVTAPLAVVRHDMSASARETGAAAAPERTDGYAFKHRFIERNLLASVAHCFEGRRALAIWARRWPALAKGRITGEFPKASGGAAWDAALRLPRTLRRRRAVQSRRRRPDAEVIAFSVGERTFFDPVRYRPVHRWEALATAARRRARVRPDDGALRWTRLAELCEDAAGAGGHESTELRALAASLHPGLAAYVAAAAGEA